MFANDWRERARSMVARAALAPSSHNTQPWIFVIDERGIELRADRTRALPENDPDDRELLVSCGCALLNLRVAAAAEDVVARVELLPMPDDADLLARVTFADDAPPDAKDARLSPFIEQRHTHRPAFASRDVDPAVAVLLREAAEREGAWLRPVATDPARREVAELVTEGDVALWANAAWRRELAAWMHPRRRGDGLTVPMLALPVTRAVVRAIDMGARTGTQDRELAVSAPLLVALGTEGDDAREWLCAGQALERVLLEARAQGLQAGFLNQPVQVAALRPKLQSLLGAGVPQVVLRLGYPAADLRAAPRRALDEVIVEHAEEEAIVA